MNYIKSYSDVNDDLIIESLINESILYFSPRMRSNLVQINNHISDRLLDIECSDVKNVDVTFVDVNELGDVTFITMANAIRLIKDRYGDGIDIDVTANKSIADILFKNDLEYIARGHELGDSGVYVRYRNTIKIGKLVNRIFKGTLSSHEVEGFVNSFKSMLSINKYKFDIVYGDDIKKWYNYNNYLKQSGTLGNSCMGDKSSSFFNIYADNPESCGLVIMTIGDKLVARALLWKINSISIKSDFLNGTGVIVDKPEYFMDRIYYIEDYQFNSMRKFAVDNGWSYRSSNTYSDTESIVFGDKSYKARISVKVNKCDYITYPYMDTFKRYEQFSGLLWNDDIKRKGGHILSSTQGNYEPSISMSKIYINRFKDFFKRD